MVLGGLVLNEDPVWPVLQVYVLAPPAVKVDVAPAHIVLGLATAVTEGRGLTVIKILLPLTQPFISVPTTP